MIKYISPGVKNKILRSFPYRLYSRMKLNQRDIRISCELTTKCNAKCRMCTRETLIQKNELHVGDMQGKTLESMLAVIEALTRKNMPITFAPMGLGEPLLFKDLFDLFRRIKSISKGIYIVLVTNGIALNDKVSKEIIESQVDEVSVSLNCTDRTTYHQQMGIDKYHHVYGNIENLIKRRDKSGRTALKIFVQYLDFGINSLDLKAEIERWNRLMSDNDKCYVHPIVNQAGYCEQGNDFESITPRYPCTQPIGRVAIKRNGEIYPCDPCFYAGEVRTASLYLGNINTEKVDEMINDAENKRYAIFDAMQKDDYSGLPECRKCNTYKLSSNCYFRVPGANLFSENEWL